MNETCPLSPGRIHLRFAHLASIIRESTCEPRRHDDEPESMARYKRFPDVAVECYVRPHGGCLAWTIAFDRDRPDEPARFTRCTRSLDIVEEVIIESPLEEGEEGNRVTIFVAKPHDGYHYGEPRGSLGTGHMWLDIGQAEPTDFHQGGMERMKRLRWCRHPSDWKPKACTGARNEAWERMHRLVLERCGPSTTKRLPSRHNYLNRARAARAHELGDERALAPDLPVERYEGVPYDFFHDCYVIDPGHCLAWEYEDDLNDSEKPRIVECIYQRGHGLRHNEGCMGWTEAGHTWESAQAEEAAEDAAAGLKPRDTKKRDERREKVWWCQAMWTRYERCPTE